MFTEPFLTFFQRPYWVTPETLTEPLTFSDSRCDDHDASPSGGTNVWESLPSSLVRSSESEELASPTVAKEICFFLLLQRRC